MKKIILMAVAVLGALAINSCRKETETIIERVEVQKGNQILSGIGAPTETLGNVGDYYLDLSNSNLYGAKTAQGWGNPISLKGIQGDKGEKGDTGATGQKGDKGDTGATGQKGEKGDTGATGQKGEKGNTGATGQKGEKGDTGATGQKGEKGDTGATGQKGEKGDTGTPGQNGSKIYAGIGAPTINIGAVGDWYIDSQNKRLYGPKETSGWSNEYIPLTVNSEIRDSDYVLSEDKKDLTKWLNKGVKKIDMNTVPELRNVNDIRFDSFAGCTELESIIIGDNVLYIQARAFSYLKKLKNITFNNKIEAISNDVFRGCTALTSLTFPKSINFFASGAFEDCPNLKTFIIKAETPPRVNTFPSLFSTGDEPTIYVPANSVENYKKAEGWKKYANKIQAIP
ncbi:collagen-like protein [Capnocytophaga sputigena]|uniref:collagen-like protein n=1 Tax=Capnocytophaga sputigena TaxID=1019 RepID=UPI0028D10C2D|nr:collagen-like protein [Capnocytophaga sputigena]